MGKVRRSNPFLVSLTKERLAIPSFSASALTGLESLPAIRIHDHGYPTLYLKTAKKKEVK